MEVIVPLFLLLLFSIATAAVASIIAAVRGSSKYVAILMGFFMPGICVAYLLCVSHFRDEYHRSRSESYNLDGNCVVALGQGYKLLFFDEFPEASQITYEHPDRPSLSAHGNVRTNLVESHVRQIALTSSDVYGVAGQAGDFDSRVDHYFWINFASGSIAHFKTESELRSKAQSIGSFISPDKALSVQEGRERNVWVTWMIALPPIILAYFCWFILRRKRVIALEDNARSFMNE